MTTFSLSLTVRPSSSRVELIIMYIYHALINALSAHMIHINLNLQYHVHTKSTVLPKHFA